MTGRPDGMLRALGGVALLMALGAPAAATVVDWSPGQALDCALPVSSPSQIATRTVVLPAGAISEVPAFWDAETQLYIKVIRNTLVMQLRDPRFSATVPVYDDHGDLFLLTVHAADAAGPVPDPVLEVRAAPAPGSSAAAAPADSDGAITEMMAMMVGGGGAGLSSAAVTRVEDGTIKRGRHLFADRILSVDLDTVYQGPRLHGYRCLLTYRGEHPVRIQAQRLWFPGALAVYASGQLVAASETPAISLNPRATCLLYYVAQ